MNEAGTHKKTSWTAPGPNEPLFIAESAGNEGGQDAGSAGIRW